MKAVRSENLAAFMGPIRGATKKIAEELGIKPPTVSEWKSGKRHVPVEYIPKICKILGVTEKDLCEPFSPFAQEWVKSPTGQKMLEVFPKLSDEGLDRVLSLALQLQLSDTKQKNDS